ncbi:hypothetical protein [Bacteroides fragilis]|uniref:hypothetical protein n=1 Tax=Bacteroides fragilis TaxID=817 RepID=UPI002810C393|nr:hypothetical protein [Bacteroides fragilis]WMI95612.1 hypothetical protein BFGS084_03044 [Bacteroides fragilis]
MSNFVPISTNLYISENSDWGNYNHEVIHDIIKTIDINFSAVLEVPPFSSCLCLIEHWDNTPMCSKIPNGHLIHLSTKENYWCQWIYQFAHEYCHHLINGTFTGDMKGLMWFEETICELSSMFHLALFHSSWSQSLEECQNRYAPSFLDYLDDLFSKHAQLISDTHHPEFLRNWIPLLEQQTYHRDYYNALSVRMFPLFVGNPHLWKMILHFGDMRQWDSLEGLFQHLERYATVDYLHSLKKLRLLLFS